MKYLSIGLLVLCCGITAFAEEIIIFPSVPRERPDTWAERMDVKGAPNLHKVSDNVYRSAQPSAEGMQNLKALGIKTIVNLRTFNSDKEEIGKTGLAYEHIYFKTWHPEKEDMIKFLKIAQDPKNSPILVYCQHGADRTGTMMALYRIAAQGWSKDDAIAEMKNGGYGFHSVWKNLPQFIEELDVDELKKSL